MCSTNTAFRRPAPIHRPHPLEISSASPETTSFASSSSEHTTTSESIRLSGIQQIVRADSLKRRHQPRLRQNLLAPPSLPTPPQPGQDSSPRPHRTRRGTTVVTTIFPDSDSGKRLQRQDADPHTAPSRTPSSARSATSSFQTLPRTDAAPTRVRHSTGRLLRPRQLPRTDHHLMPRQAPAAHPALALPVPSPPRKPIMALIYPYNPPSARPPLLWVSQHSPLSATSTS